MNETNSIELITVVFGTGESRLFGLSGEYFEVIDAPNPIDIILSDVNGAQRARMNQAGAAFFSEGVPYGVIQITSTTAQTVRFAYGSGKTGTRRATGSVTVSGAIALDAGTLAALESIDLNAATLDLLRRPLQQTGFYSANSAVAANTPETVFTPAANVNGAIVLTADIVQGDVAGANTPAVFITKASAPASVVDGSILMVTSHRLLNTQYALAGSLESPQFVAPGQGLYFITSSPVPGNTAGIRACRFRLL